MKFQPQCVALSADVVVFVMLLVVVGCTGTAKIKTLSPAGACPTPLPPLIMPRIEVVKSARTLTLYDGDKVVKKYRCCTGSVSGDKEREGDRKTPDGAFFVCYKNPGSKYTRSLGLSYPNEEDASRGLRTGLLAQAQYDALINGNRVTAEYAKKSVAAGEPRADMLTRPDGIVTIVGVDWETLWKTPLGGEVMIHGAGANRAGTAGCVGLDDADILELFQAIPVGTPVAVRP